MECWQLDCEVQTEGVVTDRVRSLSSRSGQAPCWPRIAEVPLQGLKSAGAFVLCPRAGVSERLAHDEWGVSSFPSGKGIFCVQKMVRNDRCRSNRGTALHSTNDYCLRGKCRSGLGAHASLDQVRGLCSYLLARIGMIGRDKMSVAVRGFF